MLESLYDICFECFTFLRDFSGGWITYYIITLLCFGAIHEKNSIVLEEHKHIVNPDIGNLISMNRVLNISRMSNMLFHKLANIINLTLYIKITRNLANFLKTLTGVKEKNSFTTVSKNIWTFFVFYYVVVFTPAVIMVPVGYDLELYGGIQSISALLLMMLTNAIGDLISIKITLKNIRRIYHYHQNIKSTKQRILIIEELKIYSIAIIDILLALIVLFGVLILTSIYFGVSVEEYKFELSKEFFEGAAGRVDIFFETVMHPYVFRDVFSASSDAKLPMLFIFSLTGFLPSALILFLCFCCIISIPFRFIYHSSNRIIAIIVPQVITFLYCVISLIGYSEISEFFHDNLKLVDFNI